VHGDRAIVALIVTEGSAERLDVSVKMSPTILASLSITGEPELPPMMSLVEQKFIGVSRLI